jgi:putative transcriptional regulator
MIKHHVDPEILMSYAAGTSSMPVGLIVASHITICGKCRKDVQLFEDIGGKVLEESSSIITKPETLDIILSKLDDIDIEVRISSDIKINSIFKNIPVVLHKMLPKGKTLTEKWKKGIGGIKYFDIELSDSNKNSHARMFSIPPGKALPNHGHEAQEFTLVLEGGFSDKNGDYNAGDIAIEDEFNVHSPVADSTEGCICLAVYEGNLKFKGVLGPILNLLKI